MAIDNKKVEVYIAMHKIYTRYDIDGYIPLHVGKALSSLDLGIQCDNTGPNISNKNKSYCELTALYWMWKNSDADILGLFHYRRYLGINENNKLKLLNSDGLRKAITDENTILLPYPNSVSHENKIMTTRETYERGHHIKDWELTKEIILTDYPEYYEAFEKVENSTHIYFCNLFVAHRAFINRYCEWLFDILFKLENRVDISNYDDYQKRIFGFISERLLNVFIEKHHNTLKLVSLPCIPIPEPIEITNEFSL